MVKSLNWALLICSKNYLKNAKLSAWQNAEVSDGWPDEKFGKIKIILEINFIKKKNHFANFHHLATPLIIIITLSTTSIRSVIKTTLVILSPAK